MGDNTSVLTDLEVWMGALSRAVVAYSGGADSALVAEAAHRVLGPDCLIVTADSPSLPRRELKSAVKLAAERSWAHRVLPTVELNDERYTQNQTNRCYWCKTALFEALEKLPEAGEWPVLLGTNTDDLGDWRPGQKAGAERGALQPLVDCSMSKNDVRELSRKWGLPTAEKPASACLSSRFAYGVTITQGGLDRVEKAEEVLVELGYRIIRVRDLGDDRARVEVGVEELADLKLRAASVTNRLEKLGFDKVDIDEKGYRQGALNEGVVLQLSTTRGGPPE